jgi:ERCC4-type nuclease
MTKEENKIIESFRIIVDTREQATHRSDQRYESMGVELDRAVLDYGDYTYNLTLPDGPLHDISARIKPKCVVERKQNLDELAMCFTRSRDRFRREFERAAAENARIYLLTENASLDMIMAGQYRSRFQPRAFLASLLSWSKRYNMVPVFCDMRSSGRLIKEILFRDMKERLEGGTLWETEKEKPHG